MKKIIASLVFLSILVSCGGGDAGKKEEKTTEETTSTSLSDNPDYKKGLKLVSPPNDCLTCHKVDEVLTGPSYRDVAKKYANYPDTIIKHLAGKIKSGGNGVWGETFMTPHPGVSQEDAEAMVKYILLLKK